MSGLSRLSAHASVYGNHGLRACDIINMSMLLNFEEAC
jgi:hypothetical protein